MSDYVDPTLGIVAEAQNETSNQSSTMQASDFPAFNGNFRRPMVADLIGALRPMTQAEIDAGLVKSQ